MIREYIKNLVSNTWQDAVVNGLAIGFAAIASQLGCCASIALAIEFTISCIVRLVVNSLCKESMEKEVSNDCVGFVLGNVVASFQLFPLAGAVVCMVTFGLRDRIVAKMDHGYSFRKAVTIMVVSRITND